MQQNKKELFNKLNWIVRKRTITTVISWQSLTKPHAVQNKLQTQIFALDTFSNMQPFFLLTTRCCFVNLVKNQTGILCYYFPCNYIYQVMLDHLQCFSLSFYKGNLVVTGTASSNPTRPSSASSNGRRDAQVLWRVQPRRERVQVQPRAAKLWLRHQLFENRGVAPGRRNLCYCLPTGKL